MWANIARSLSEYWNGPIRILGQAPGPALAALAIALLPTFPARGAIVEEIVAKVNDRIITKTEFQERSDYILHQIAQQGGPDTEASLRDAKDSMLANMITELLLVERAETLLDMSKVRQNLIEDFRKQQKIESDDDLERLLKEQRMTRRDLEEQLIRLTVPQEVINYEVRRRVSVSDREIKEYYDEHRKQYETPPQVTLREVVLFYEPVTRPEVLTRAEGVVREVKAGAEFVDLVQRASEAGTKEAGGLLDPLSAAELHPEIARAAFALEPGQVSEPIDTGRSFHIVRVEAKTPLVVRALEEAHDEIYNAIRERKFRPRYEAYLRKVWEESRVEVMPKYEAFLAVTPLRKKPAPAPEPAPRPPAPDGS